MRRSGIIFLAVLEIAESPTPIDDQNIVRANVTMDKGTFAQVHDTEGYRASELPYTPDEYVSVPSKTSLMH